MGRINAFMASLIAMVPTSDGQGYGYGEYAKPRSLTAGTNKYAKRVSNEEALTDEEKRRNAEIDAKNAAKKAARKGG